MVARALVPKGSSPVNGQLVGPTRLTNVTGIGCASWPIPERSGDFSRSDALTRHMVSTVGADQQSSGTVGRNTRLINPDTSTNSVLDALGHDKVVVCAIVAGGNGGRKDNPFDAAREARGQEFIGGHIEVPPDTPRAATRLELMLKMVEHNTINRPSALFAMLQVNREAYEASSQNATNFGDANPVGNPLLHKVFSHG